MTHPGTNLTTDGTDGTDAGPRSLVLSLSGQLANHKEQKNAKPGTWEREGLHPPEVGSISPTAGFSLCSLRSLWLNGSVWFYPCHPWSKSLTAPKP